MPVDISPLIELPSACFKDVGSSAAVALVLARDWRIKAAILAIVSAVPGGRAAYRFFQDRRERAADADDLMERAFDLVALYRAGGGQVRGGDFLELGTGWCPWTPLMLMLGGARRVVTFDVNPWLSLRTARQTTAALLERAARVSGELAVPVAAIEKQLRPLLDAQTLREWLDAARIGYLPQTDICRAGFASDTFDAILSSNVLEHVPPRDLVRIHEESRRVLRNDGLIAHRFNPQDHFSFADSSITGANFLRFSESAWKCIGGSGLAYHNRLRCCQHRSLIEAAGFRIEHLRTRPDEAARRLLETGRLRVHPDFTGLTPEELSDDYMWVVARNVRGRAGERR